MNKISIIIPTYKEENNIGKTLSNLEKKGFGNSEIIIIDGSPDDLTKEEIKKINNKNIFYKKLENSFRSNSMNDGAKTAKGDLLVFLHADSFLPENSFEELSKLDLNKYDYGCFYKKFNPDNFLLKILEILNNFQTKFFKTMLGDNGIFISKEKFNEVGGFQNIKLMEDIEISKTLKKQGNMKIIKNKIITSSRKFQKKGFFKTIIFMQYIRFLYFIGTDTKILEERYRKF